MVRDPRLSTSSHAKMPSWERPYYNSLRGKSREIREMRVSERQPRRDGPLRKEKVNQKAYERNVHDLVTLDLGEPHKLDGGWGSPGDSNVDGRN